MKNKISREVSSQNKTPVLPNQSVSVLGNIESSVSYSTSLSCGEDASSKDVKIPAADSFVLTTDGMALSFAISISPNMSVAVVADNYHAGAYSDKKTCAALLNNETTLSNSNTFRLLLEKNGEKPTVLQS